MSPIPPEPRAARASDTPPDLDGLEGLVAGPAQVLRFVHTPPEEARSEPEADSHGAAREVAQDPESVASEPTGQTAEGEPARPWHLDVVVVADSPAPGYCTYATSGLRQWPTNIAAADGREMRTELVAVSRAAYRTMADVLDACAEAISAGSVHVAPGAVLPDAIRRVDPDRVCPHIVLVPPFLWPELQVVDARDADAVLTRLQAVPLAATELRLLADQGADALFAALEAAGADVTDPDRPAVA